MVMEMPNVPEPSGDIELVESEYGFGEFRVCFVQVADSVNRIDGLSVDKDSEVDVWESGVEIGGLITKDSQGVNTGYCGSKNSRENVRMDGR